MNRILKYYLDTLIRTGDFTVIDAEGTSRNWGDGTGKPLTVRFNTRAAERAVALNPSLKFGEAYMNGGTDVVDGGAANALIAVLVDQAAAAVTAEKLFKQRAVLPVTDQVTTLDTGLAGMDERL